MSFLDDIQITMQKEQSPYSVKLFPEDVREASFRNVPYCMYDYLKGTANLKHLGGIVPGKGKHTLLSIPCCSSLLWLLDEGVPTLVGVKWL